MRRRAADLGADDPDRPPPDYVAPAPARSTYQWSKNGLIRDLLRESGAASTWHEPEPMPRAWLEAVHDPEYVGEVLAAQVPRDKERRIGFPVTPNRSRGARRWCPAARIWRRGWRWRTASRRTPRAAATMRSPTPARAFACSTISRSPPVRLVEEGTVARSLVVDVDVHQGDGTAALCAGRPGIATYSIHAEKNFPVRKARSTVDVPLAGRGGGRRSIWTTLEATLAPLLDELSRPS